MSPGKAALGLFEGYGVEIEYMIADRESLAVRPLADEVLKAAAGRYTCDYEEGPVGWSNELVLHVLELKMNGPTPSLAGWAARFDADVARIGALLAPHGALLLPGAMHPTMDPTRETRLWPHEYAEVYAAYHRIFNCHHHGWANLQSVHLNLPFRGDREFGALHAACRAVLPLLPALAASSPVMDGRLTGRMDNRLHVYCTHQSRLPSTLGDVIPEPIWTRADYERQVLQPMYRAIAPHDPHGELQHEFLNARGAIARFERDAVEIRLLDVQEHPRADLALCLLVTAAVQALVEERWASLATLQALPTAPLRALLMRTIDDAEETLVDEPALLAVFGLDRPLPAGEFWRRIAAQVSRPDAAWTELRPAIERVLQSGPLARRLARAYGPQPAPERIREVLRELARCLAGSRFFDA